MCYDISFSIAIAELEDYFPGLVFDEQLKINFESAIHITGHAYGIHPVIYKNRDDEQLHCRGMEWGVIPFYVKEEAKFLRQRATMLNARSERILDDKASYWHKIRNRRCLVPVSGFYEHREVPKFKKKVPYFIRLNDQPLFFLPGLYSVTELPNEDTGEVIKRWTFTIITRSANTVMKAIHNGGDNAGRMPLMLPFEMAKEYVSEELTEDSYREILQYEMPSDKLDYTTVYTIRSSKGRTDGLAKNEHWEWENLPQLEMLGQ